MIFDKECKLSDSLLDILINYLCFIILSKWAGVLKLLNLLGPDSREK